MTEPTDFQTDAHPEEAGKLVAVGESEPPAGIAPPKLAAWTLVANQLLNLDEFISHN